MKKIFLVLFTLTVQTCFAQSGWFWQNPQPQGANITDVKFISTNVVIAATRGTCIMKSTDKGITWTVKNIVQKEIGYFSTLNYLSVINANTIFVMQKLFDLNKGIYKNRFLKSTDVGETWSKTDMPIFGYQNEYNLKFINNNTGFACGTDVDQTDVYRTTNAGLNWERFYVNGNDSLTSFYFLNSNTGWVGSKNSRQFYKTTNGGLNWSTYSLQISSMGEMERWLYSFFLNENTGWFQAWGYAYKTTNGGNNWTQAPFSFSNDLLFINELTGFRTSSKTTNGGVNWTSQIMDQDYNTFALSDNNLSGVLVGKYGKMQITSNAGNSWTDVLKTITPFAGYPENYEQIFFADANTGWFISWLSGLYKTTNGGTNWSMQLTGTYTSKLNFINQNTGLAGSNSNISRTTNGGANWISVYSGGNCNSLAYFKNDTAIAQMENSGNTQQLIRSTNGGINWTNVGGQLPFYEDNVHFINSQLAFCSLGPSLYKSTNGGISWIHLHSFFDTPLYNLHFLNENTGFVNLDSGIYKTTNGGSTFSRKIYLSGGSIASYQFINERTGWVAGGIGGIGILLKTTDEGETWQQDNTNDCKTYNSIFFINENTGWICGDESAILKTTTGGTIGIQQISTSLPDKFYLEQNYPNPFNPNTNIEFSLPQKSFVKLKVIDLLGREVANLVNEILSAGSYKYDFNASLLPSGIYFYKLETENFSEVRKMILVK